MLRREDGNKYLDIDGAHAVVHACSSVENYLDRYTNGGASELTWSQDGTIDTSQSGHLEKQECCYCGKSFQIGPRFPNTCAEVECSHCRKGQVLYTVQMPAGFEEALDMENPAGRGYGTIWLTVPLQHPEFSQLLKNHGMVTWKSPHRLDRPLTMADTVGRDLKKIGVQFQNTWQNIQWFEGPNGAPWWPRYRQSVSGVAILTEM